MVEETEKDIHFGVGVKNGLIKMMEIVDKVKKKAQVNFGIILKHFDCSSPWFNV